MINKYDLSMVRGDTLEFDVTIDGGDLAITAVYMTAKAAVAPAADLFQLSLGDGITATADGWHFRVPPEATFNAVPGLYNYDVQFETDDDVYTPLIGKLEILNDVTHIEPEP